MSSPRPVESAPLLPRAIARSGTAIPGPASSTTSRIISSPGDSEIWYAVPGAVCRDALPGAVCTRAEAASARLTTTRDLPVEPRGPPRPVLVGGQYRPVRHPFGDHLREVTSG